MGIESFWVKIYTESQAKEFISESIKADEAFLKAFSFYAEDEEFCFSGAMVSFLPACKIVFNILEAIHEKYKISEIASAKEKREYGFNSFIEFFSWMYNSNEEKIDYFHKEWGGIVIHPTRYYSTRRKLRRKYFCRF